MHYVLLAIGVLLGLYGLYRFFLAANTKQIAALFLTGAFLIVCVALFYLAVTGRLAAALGLAAAGYPLIYSIWRHHRKSNAQDGDNKNPSRDSGPMTRTEALEVLGLDENTTMEDIKTAHRRLIRKIHPDQEGSGWLTAKINAARDLLLKD